MLDKTIIFWRYDLFPHVLWAEYERMEGGKFYPKGWQNAYLTRKSILAILSEQDAEPFIMELKKLKESREKELMIFEHKVQNTLERLRNA